MCIKESVRRKEGQWQNSREYKQMRKKPEGMSQYKKLKQIRNEGRYIGQDSIRVREAELLGYIYICIIRDLFKELIDYQAVEAMLPLLPKVNR
jgi:hypothetical protein